MHYLVTGGAGFIGSHLVDALLAQNTQVTVIDNLSTGSRKNLAAHQDNPKLSLKIASVAEHDCLAAVINDCDRVIHLAASVGVRRVIEHPLTSVTTDVDATRNLLNLCAQLQKPLLLASTSEVYGKNADCPLAENANCVLGSSDRPRWGYAAGKLLTEHMVRAYATEQGLQAIVARLFNVIGPRQTGTYGMVVPRFIGQAQRKEPLTVYGDGQQTRTFTWVGETVKAILRLVNTPCAYGEIVNIGGTEEVSIQDLADRIIQRSRSSSGMALVPYQQAYDAAFEDMPRRQPNTDKLQTLIGYRPAMKLNEMLDQLLATMDEPV